MSKFEKVGGGRFGVYREKKSSWGEILGGIVFAVIVLAIIGSIFG